jgi:hypothetical protein
MHKHPILRSQLRVAQRVIDGLGACFTPAGYTHHPGQTFKHLSGLVIGGCDRDAHLINTHLSQQRLDGASKHGLPRKQTILLRNRGIVRPERARANPCGRHKGNQAILAF